MSGACDRGETNRRGRRLVGRIEWRIGTGWISRTGFFYNSRSSYKGKEGQCKKVEQILDIAGKYSHIH